MSFNIEYILISKITRNIEKKKKYSQKEKFGSHSEQIDPEHRIEDQTRLILTNRLNIIIYDGSFLYV